MDVLAALLADLHLESSFFCPIEGSGAWGVRYPSGPIAAFHVVTRGRVRLERDGHPPVLLAAGDLVLVPDGGAHLLLDADGLGRRAARPIAAHLRLDGGPEQGSAIDGAIRLQPLRLGAAPRRSPTEAVLGAPAVADATPAVLAGAVTELPGDSAYLCGAFRFAAPIAENPVLSAFPPLLVLRGASGRPQPWLRPLLDALRAEAEGARDGTGWGDAGGGGGHAAGVGRPGSALVLRRLADVLFVQTVRAHLDALPAEAAGWLAALRDPPLARVLAAMHREPERGWTVAALARVAGASRSAFAARFTARVGQPPLAYLASWRMHRARTLLRDGGLDVGQVARALGYASPAAFSTAFRRSHGIAPGRWRTRARGSVSGPDASFAA